MQKITVPTAFNIELEFESADFLNRFLAWILDMLVIIAYLILAYSCLANYYASEGFGRSFFDNLSAWQTIIFAPALVYHVALEAIMNGQTLGKKICKIKVVSETGARPALYQLLIRWLTRCVDFTFTSYLCALIVSSASKKGQRLGDIAAGTMVIKSKLQGDLYLTVFEETAETYRPRYMQALQLSDRDMNTIKSALVKHYARQAPQQRIDLIAETIRNALNIHEYQENVSFLETLLKDYNHLSNQ